MENILVGINPRLFDEVNKLVREKNISRSPEEFVNSAVRSYLIEYRAKKIQGKTKPLISKLKKSGYGPKPITRKEKIKTAENYLKEKGLKYDGLSQSHLL